jgi:hypothetical protein
MGKITLEFIESIEAEIFLQDVFNNISNSEYVTRYCGSALKDILLSLAGDDRKSLIDLAFSNDEKDYGFKGVTNTSSTLDNEIAIPVGEIEFPFEGNPEDVFDAEALSDLYIEGNLAYLPAGYFSMRFDLEKLKEGLENNA